MQARTVRPGREKLWASCIALTNRRCWLFCAGRAGGLCSASPHYAFDALKIKKLCKISGNFSLYPVAGDWDLPQMRMRKIKSGRYEPCKCALGKEFGSRFVAFDLPRPSA